MNTVIDEKIELWRSGGAPKSSKLSGIDVLIEPLMIELENCHAYTIQVSSLGKSFKASLHEKERYLPQERRRLMKDLIETEEREYNDELTRLGKFLWRES